MPTTRVSLDDHIFEGENRQSTMQPTVSAKQVERQHFVSSQPKKRFQIGKITAIVLSLALVFGIFRFVLPFFASGLVLGSNSDDESGLITQPQLKADATGKTNVLMVGVDTRETGQVELNTDTIILASYEKETNRLTMISFPRDLAVTYSGTEIVGRINAAYAYAENKKKGSGLEALQTLIEQLSGQKVQYAAMVDLKGFTDAIDVIGGIDIYLDYDLSGLYPTASYDYERVSFKRGWNHFSGQQALKYSRMRKDMVPASEEGDFARALRQQKVIQAVIEKTTKTETLLNAKRIMELFSVASKNVKTTRFGIEELQAGVSILKSKGKPVTHSTVLDLHAGGSAYRLIDVVNANPYLLGPRLGMGNWGEIQGYIKEYFTEPTLVTMDKKVAVYHYSASTEYVETFSKMVKRHYFATIYDAGVYTPPADSVENVAKVIAVGGKNYENAARFLAKEYDYSYSTDLVGLPTDLPQDVAIVIIL